MPKNKDFYHRIEIIDECLRRRNKNWPLTELIDCVNTRLLDQFGKSVSRRTIQYDLNYLINEKGAPIEKVKEGNEVFYRYADANYSIKNLPLTDEEIILLKDAVEVLRQISGLTLVQDMEGIVGKLEHAIAADLAQSQSCIQFEKHTSSSGSDCVDDLFTAIKEKIVLKIIYQPFGKEPYHWIIHPYLLKQYRNRWFLIGLHQEINKVVTLALDRIKGIGNSKETFIENNFFDPATYFNNLIGVTFPEGETVSDIILNVQANQVPYINTKPIHFTQEIIQTFADGSLQIKLRLINNYELKSVLLGYGSDLEVVAPQTLREQMKKVFLEGSRMYS
jgi:predicted DNA-binding transcriptional regulator YafY